jgi:hypothetical protein
MYQVRHFFPSSQPTQTLNFRLKKDAIDEVKQWCDEPVTSIIYDKNGYWVAYKAATGKRICWQKNVKRGCK